MFQRRSHHSLVRVLAPARTPIGGGGFQNQTVQGVAVGDGCCGLLVEGILLDLKVNSSVLSDDTAKKFLIMVVLYIVVLVSCDLNRLSSMVTGTADGRQRTLPSVAAEPTSAEFRGSKGSVVHGVLAMVVWLGGIHFNIVVVVASFLFLPLPHFFA